jgi:hypothetical protein
MLITLPALPPVGMVTEIPLGVKGYVFSVCVFPLDFTQGLSYRPKEPQGSARSSSLAIECEAAPWVAQRIQASGAGNDSEGGVVRTGVGDPGEMLHGSSLIACGDLFQILSAYPSCIPGPFFSCQNTLASLSMRSLLSHLGKQIPPVPPFQKGGEGRGRFKSYATGGQPPSPPFSKGGRRGDFWHGDRGNLQPRAGRSRERRTAAP